MSRKKIELPTENYLEKVSIFFLNMLGRGFILSPIDISLIEKWERLGYPLINVLNGLKKGFKKVTAERGEPYSALKCYGKYVEEEVGKIKEKTGNTSIKRIGENIIIRGIKKIEKVSEDSPFYEKYQKIKLQLIELKEKYSDKMKDIKEINRELENIDMEIIEFIDKTTPKELKEELLNEAKLSLKRYRFINAHSYNETLKELYKKLLRKHFNIIRFGA